MYDIIVGYSIRIKKLLVRRRKDNADWIKRSTTIEVDATRHTDGRIESFTRNVKRYIRCDETRTRSETAGL